MASAWFNDGNDAVCWGADNCRCCARAWVSGDMMSPVEGALEAAVLKGLFELVYDAARWLGTPTIEDGEGPNQAARSINLAVNQLAVLTGNASPDSTIDVPDIVRAAARSGHDGLREARYRATLEGIRERTYRYLYSNPQTPRAEAFNAAFNLAHEALERADRSECS